MTFDSAKFRSVILAYEGIQGFQPSPDRLDTRFRGYDSFFCETASLEIPAESNFQIKHLSLGAVLF